MLAWCLCSKGILPPATSVRRGEKAFSGSRDGRSAPWISACTILNTVSGAAAALRGRLGLPQCALNKHEEKQYDGKGNRVGKCLPI